MYQNSEVLQTLPSNPFFKKKKKPHPCRHLVERSAGGLGGGGDYPQFWILNCNIENRLFSVITEQNVLYRFFPFAVFDTSFRWSDRRLPCLLKVSALNDDTQVCVLHQTETSCMTSPTFTDMGWRVWI